MAVRARPGAVQIENFRGIPRLDLELHSRTSTYIIGPNNAGKSTVLNAVALAFKGAAFRTFTPEPFDFFRDAARKHSGKFAVRVLFDPDGEALPAVRKVGDPVDVHGVAVLGRTEKYGRLVHRHVLLDEQLRAIALPARTRLKGDLVEQYKEHDVGFHRPYARPNEINEHLPEVWLLSPQNLERSLYHWRTGPLRRLTRLLTTRFFEEEWELPFGDKTRPMPASLERVHTFLRDAVTRFPFWTEDLKPRLEETLSKYVGRQAGMDLQPSVEALEEWLADQLIVAFAVDAGGPITPLEKMGQGWQSLVRIAALDVLRQYPDEVKQSVVLLYEEPETYLHPHLSRKLRAVLDDLADLGWTVMCSTHSPDFVSFRSNQSIVRLRREGEAVEKGALFAKDLASGPKFQELLDERGNHELLFGNKVVLCEGKDDVVGLRHYLEESNADLDGRSISVVDLGGVATLPQYARMASDLGIPWCGLTDEDVLPDGSLKPVTRKARERLTELAAAHDLIVTWKGDLETCLAVPGGRKATPEWQADNLLGLDGPAIRARYPDFTNCCEAILAWILDDDDAPA